MNSRTLPALWATTYDTLRAACAAIFAVWEDNARAAAQLDSILTKKTKGSFDKYY